jgi:membrane protein YqaA with SNARE-associated domain
MVEIMNTDDSTETEVQTISHPARACPRCELSIALDAEYCKHCGAKVGPHKHVPWWQVHRRMYDWVLHFAHHKHSTTALFCLSFAESSFFPVPPDVLLAPLVLGNSRKWFRYAFVCSLASVLGAVAGYLIGWLAWGAGLDNVFFNYVPGFTPKVFANVSELYDKYNFWIVFTAGFTPIPFKVITITAGVFGTGAAVANPLEFFVMFLIASIISRSARFFLVAGLMRIFGPTIAPRIDKYFNWLALAFVVLLIGGVVIMKYAF